MLVLGGFGIYATWAALQNANYYVGAVPVAVLLALPGRQLPARHAAADRLLVEPLAGLPDPRGFRGGFRATCYYYRKAYYRSFFWSPPACAVPDARQALPRRDALPVPAPEHPPLLLLAVARRAGLPVVGRAAGVPLPDGFGIGLGTLVLVVNAALLSLYTFSCHSCRHLCGGYLDSFQRARPRYRLWRFVTRLNERHMLFAWISLFGVRSPTCTCGCCDGRDPDLRFF